MPKGMLFQDILVFSVFSSKDELTTMPGKKIFSVADGLHINCFDNNETDEVSIVILKNNPYYFVTCNNLVH